MSIQSQLAAEFKNIAPAMESLQKLSNAKVDYHLLADAIYWTDEIPEQVSRLAENFLRGLLHYRTSLLLEQPVEKWQMYWNEGQRQFPRWIGFGQERTVPTTEIKNTIADLRRKSGRR